MKGPHMFNTVSENVRLVVNGLFGRSYGFFDYLIENGQLSATPSADIHLFAKPAKAAVPVSPVVIEQQAA
jgi:hypothetical protein